jgi:hypothetical protein
VSFLQRTPNIDNVFCVSTTLSLKASINFGFPSKHLSQNVNINPFLQQLPPTIFPPPNRFLEHTSLLHIAKNASQSSRGKRYYFICVCSGCKTKRKEFVGCTSQRSDSSLCIAPDGSRVRCLPREQHPTQSTLLIHPALTNNSLLRAKVGQRRAAPHAAMRTDRVSMRESAPMSSGSNGRGNLMHLANGQANTATHAAVAGWHFLL